MVVAVVTVRMVQMAVHQVINVIAMRHGFMATAWAMYMACRMAVALVAWGTALGVEGVDHQAMFIDMIAMHMVQVAVMQVVNVAIVLYRRVATACLVLVVMIGMLRASTHAETSFDCYPDYKCRSRVRSARTILLPLIGSTGARKAISSNSIRFCAHYLRDPRHTQRHRKKDIT